MLSGSEGLSNDLRKMDPETQARLETLLEAAGMLMFYYGYFNFSYYTFYKLYIEHWSYITMTQFILPARCW